MYFKFLHPKSINKLYFDTIIISFQPANYVGTLAHAHGDPHVDTWPSACMQDSSSASMPFSHLVLLLMCKLIRCLIVAHVPGGYSPCRISLARASACMPHAYGIIRSKRSYMISGIIAFVLE